MSRPVLPFAKVSILGGGAYGTSLAIMLANKCPTARIDCWLIDPKEATEIEAARENTVYFPKFRLPDGVHFSSDASAVLSADPELVIVTIPTQFMRTFFRKNAPLFVQHCHRALFIMASKGIEISDTLAFPFEIAKQELPKVLHSRMACMCGPSFAKEIAELQFTAITVAAEKIETARLAQQLLTFPGTFRLYASTDVIGSECTSAVKNVLAIACGACASLGFENNTRAALITRGIAEMRALATSLGSSGEAIQGLAGLGDTVLTCSSPLSRNFTVGARLGKGETMEQIRKSMKATAEGVPTAKAVVWLAKRQGVPVPLCEAVCDLVWNGKNINEIVHRLTNKPLTDEREAIAPRRSKL